MKKLLLLLSIFVLATMHARGESVDESTARSMAQEFLSDMSVYNPQSLPNSGSSPLQLIHAEVSDVSVTMNAYYVFGSSTGFVIIAGDDRAQRILGYGSGDFNLNNVPCALRFMLDSYKEQIDYLFEHPGLEVETMSFRATSDSGTSVEPLLTSKWNQGVPYNLKCPTYNGQPCYTGCACTSLCQVMYYWKYPYGDTPSLPEYTTSTYGIYRDELPPTTFDWDNMIDSYSGSYTTDQANAVAELMRYVGQAELMDYGPNGSGAYTSSVLTAAKLFGYDSNAKHVTKDRYWSSKPYYTDEEWISMILTELREGRPIVYMAQSEDGSGGHGFNLDGYDAVTHLFHINWGWGGYLDDYFALNAFTVSEDGSYAFNRQQSMIIGLQPSTQAELWVDQSSLDFNARVGESVSQTFSVIGYNLADDVKLTLLDPEGYYYIDKTSISPAEAENGVTVTVTYNPTEVGSSFAEVRLTSRGVEHKTVFLSGEASLSNSIEVDIDSILFGDVEVGYPVSKTLNVKGYNLTSNINLRTQARSVNYFKVTTEVITPEQAAQGVKVKVTYSPGSSYWSTADLILSCDDAEDMVIPMTANPYTPEDSFHNNETQEFTAYLGQIVNVKGSIWFADAEIPPDPNHPVVMLNGSSATLAANGIDYNNYQVEIEGDNCFRAMIVKTSSIANTCKVMITYSPASRGTHQARLVATCRKAGVPIVVIKLRGEATLLTADPIALTAVVDDPDEKSFEAQWKMDCYEIGISDFMIECAPAGSGFNPDDMEYRCYADLLPEECPFNGYNVLLGLGRKYSYTIDDLTPGAVYDYRVKAHFIDDTWSEWSNVETVALHHEEITVGDMNGDGLISVTDLTSLIDGLLNGVNDGLKAIADVDGDGEINIGDISALIDRVLGQ